MIDDASGRNEPQDPNEPEQEGESADPILVVAEDLIRDPAPLLRKVRLDPDALSHIGDGF